MEPGIDLKNENIEAQRKNNRRPKSELKLPTVFQLCWPVLRRNRKSAVNSMAGGLGFEPRLAESESAVLPLDDPPRSSGIRAKRQIGWLALRLSLASGSPRIGAEVLPSPPFNGKGDESGGHMRQSSAAASAFLADGIRQKGGGSSA